MRTLLKLLFSLKLQLRAPRVFVGEGDKLPGSLLQRPFEDIEIAVISQDAEVAPVLAVPPVHHLVDFHGPVPKQKTDGALVAFVSRIALDLDLQRCPFCKTFETVIIGQF